MLSEQVAARLMRTVVEHALGSPAPTAIPRSTIWWSSKPTNPTPAMFEAKFYILLQGAKRLTIGGEAYDFQAGTCAVSCVALPFTSQVVKASPSLPYVGLELRPDPGMIASLLLEMPSSCRTDAPAFATAQADANVTDPLDRLVRLLAVPADLSVLAPQFERELYYRLLQGPLGETLRQIVQQSSCLQQIRTAVEWLRVNAHSSMRVPELAAKVGMSVTSFHRHFKAVTAHSPLAYQRHIRLLDARRLVASGATNVTTAAFRTGYASTAQFSREYKRLFGVSPTHDAPALR